MILSITAFPAALGILIGATVIDLAIVAVAFKDFLSKGDAAPEEKKDDKELDGGNGKKKKRSLFCM